MNEHRPVEGRSQALTPPFGANRVPLVCVAEAAAFERVLAQLSQPRGVMSEPAADDAVSEGEGNSFNEHVERLERFDHSLSGEESGKVVDYIDLVVPVVAFVQAVLPAAGLSDHTSDLTDSQEDAGDGGDLGVDAIDPVSALSGEDPVDRDMAGFDETGGGGDGAETKSDAVEFDHDASASGRDSGSDDASNDDQNDSFERAIDELLRDVAPTNVLMADPSITSVTASRAALPLVERLDSPTDAAGVSDVAEAAPAARGDSLDDDTPDVEDGEVEAPADAGALGGVETEEFARLERRTAITDQDERAREAAHLSDVLPSVRGPAASQTDQPVAVGDDNQFATRLSEGSHFFEMVGGTSPIQSVEVVQHANGRVTANVLVMQDYAGEMSELLERVRGRLGRFNVSLLRLFVGEHMVAEIRPDQETNDEPEHDA
ncbi:MAG: hypothetical protein H7Y33_17000 [Cytophagales bacterium]|nr:hypothetical protein [Rhizobacter sp.]